MKLIGEGTFGYVLSLPDSGGRTCRKVYKFESVDSYRECACLMQLRHESIIQLARVGVSSDTKQYIEIEQHESLGKHISQQQLQMDTVDDILLQIIPRAGLHARVRLHAQRRQAQQRGLLSGSSRCAGKANRLWKRCQGKRKVPHEACRHNLVPLSRDTARGSVWPIGRRVVCGNNGD